MTRWLTIPITVLLLTTASAHNCCVTQNCCFKVDSKDMTALPDGFFRVVASGQVVARTGYSRDGHFWRCACDQINGKWTVHLKANTRCIFPPMQMF